jgi:L-lactate dehydrogenase complex protein LldE
MAAAKETRLRIALFITCYNDTLFPATGKAVVRVLEKLGHTVEFPAGQTCCGQMHVNTGYWNDALPLLPRFVEQFRHAEAVVVPSSSCVAHMREHFPAMARELEDTGKQNGLAAAVDVLLPRVFEFSELLTRLLNVTDVGAIFPHRVTYHASCHGLRNLHLGSGPADLLHCVRNTELAPLPGLEQCCGFGGTFAIKNADVSSAMLEEKLDAIQSTGATAVTACDNSCLLHIAGGLHRRGVPIRSMHLAEILAADEEQTG